MDDFASETDSDYTSYWRDWVSVFYHVLICHRFRFVTIVCLSQARSLVLSCSHHHRLAGGNVGLHFSSLLFPSNVSMPTPVLSIAALQWLEILHLVCQDRWRKHLAVVAELAATVPEIRKRCPRLGHVVHFEKRNIAEILSNVKCAASPVKFTITDWPGLSLR